MQPLENEALIKTNLSFLSTKDHSLAVRVVGILYAKCAGHTYPIDQLFMRGSKKNTSTPRKLGQQV